MSTITFGVGLLGDIFLCAPIFALKNKLSLCATPLDVLVSILYWTLHTIDKRLVIPPGHELPFIPDFGFHALPAVMLTLDFMLFGPHWSIKASTAMTLSLLLAVSYWTWVEYCFSRNRWYPYPLLAQLSGWQKLFLCIILASLLASSMMWLQWLYERVNRNSGIRRATLDSTKPVSAKE
ncbi:hypothetical protein DH86_00000504 [Scytalidium sp. 3C]|nr:hypothetical protein DH86_00000504 [Scytalidium sp. 3C]